MNGKRHILNYQGTAVHEVDLPPAKSTPNWNGALAAPTLTDIDGDADLEVVLNTANSGFVAYDLPGTAGTRILWGTGRGGYLRNGTAAPPLSGDLSGNFRVGMADVILALKIAAGIVSGSGPQLAAEVNKDGRVGLAEAIFGLQRLSELR